MNLNSYSDAARQYADNYALARQETFTNNRSMQKREVDEPVILYDESWIKSPKKLLDKLRRVSDYMLFNPHLLHEFDNPNQAYLIDVVKGKLRMDDYYLADTLFGEAGPVATKDNHFFHGARAALKGQVLSHPFQFTTKNINTAFAKQQIKEQSRAASKVLGQALIEAAGQKGMNLDFARNKKIPLPKDADELLGYMNMQERVENIIYKLLQHTDYQHSFQQIGSKAFDNKFDVNAQFAYMDVVNNELVPKYYHSDQVRWMASRRVETLEDPNVLAACVMDYMTPTELLNHFGIGLQTGTGIKGIINYIDAVTKFGRQQVGYDLEGQYWTDEGYSGWGLGSDLRNDKIQGYTRKQINWMNRSFYPVMNFPNGLLMNILVQRCYVKIIKQKRYKVERIENNVSRPATDRELKYWQETNFDRKIDLRFVSVDEKGKENLSRSNVKLINKTELFQFTRVGHDSFINVGPYDYAPDPNGETPSYVGMPIIGQISYEKSMAKLGESDAIRANVLYKAIDEYLINMGLSEAIIVDDAQGQEPLEYLYNVKKSGIARYDSTLMQPNNNAQLRNLTTLKLSNHTEELQVAFAMIRDITTRYETRLGLSPQVQGISEKYDGLKETQLNIANQTLLLTQSLSEHTQFMNQVLQRAADILKKLYSYNGKKNIMLTDGEREMLQLTYMLSLADIDVKLESGQIIENRLNLIRGIVQSMAASGGAEQGEALLAVSMTSNPAEAMAIYRRLREKIEKAEQQKAEYQQQALQQSAQIEAAKMQNELKKEQMRVDGLIRVQAMKNDEKGNQVDAKGQLNDINEVNDRQKMILDAQLKEGDPPTEQQ